MRTQLPATKTVAVMLAVFVVCVLTLDAYALQQFAPQDESLGAASITSRLSAATTTVPEHGKSFGELIRALFDKKEKKNVVTPPVRPPRDQVTGHDDDTPADDEAYTPADEEEQQQEEEEEYVEPEYEWPTEEEEPAFEYESLPDTEETVYGEDTTVYSDPSGEGAAELPAEPAAKAPIKKVVAPRTIGALPDLYVGEIVPLTSSDIHNLAPYQPLGFSIRVDNAGSREALAFTTRIRVDEHADHTWDTETALAPQGIVPALNTQRLIASDVIRTTPGKNVVEICVDSAAQVAESNEKNNCRAVEYTVADGPVPVAKKPSLIYSAYQAISQFFSGVSK